MIVVVGDVGQVGAAETEAEAVEAGTETSVVVEVAVAVVAATEAVEVILEEVAETSEVEEVESSTVAVVEGVAEVVVLGNKEGTWPSLPIFPLILSEIQYIRRERPIDFGRPSYGRVSR